MALGVTIGDQQPGLFPQGVDFHLLLQSRVLDRRVPQHADQRHTDQGLAWLEKNFNAFKPDERLRALEQAQLSSGGFLLDSEEKLTKL